MQKPTRPNTYVKYSGLGLQLVAICFVLVLLGIELDKWFNQEQTFKLIGIFAAVFAVIFVLIKKLK